MAERTPAQRESLWVLQAQSGSHEALNELFKSIQEPLFRYIVSLVRDQHLAEDILQEVFIRIYRKLRWLRELQAFRAWTYQIASREAFRYLNRERRWSDQVRDEATLAVQTAVEKEFSRELIESLPQLVEKLSPASRAVVVLFYLHEMSWLKRPRCWIFLLGQRNRGWRMAWKACAEISKKRRSEMQESLEDSGKFKRQIKRALIVFAVVELIVMVFAVFQVTHK